MKSNTQLKEYTFVFLGNSRFGGLHHREHALAAELAKRGYAVTFVEEMPSLASKTRDWLMSRTVGAKKPPQTSESLLAESLRILTPPAVPTFFRSSYTPAVDRFLFRRWFRKCFRGQDWSHTVLIVTLPYWWLGFIDKQLCPANTLIYDCHDALEVPSRNTLTLHRMRLAEDRLLQDADIITYSAQGMARALSNKSRKSNLWFLPNAVGSDFRTKASKMHIHRGKKSIGYVGSLDERWIDHGLLLKVAQAYGDCNIEIIGPADGTLRNYFNSTPNVSLVGVVGHDEIASTLSRFDVLLMPFKQNPITDVVNPLKLYEYCASGNPIVAMRTAELERYSKYIYLANDQNEFVQCIRAALQESDQSLRDARIAFAHMNTWEMRVLELLSFLSGIQGS